MNESISFIFSFFILKPRGRRPPPNHNPPKSAHTTQTAPHPTPTAARSRQPQPTQAHPAPTAAAGPPPPPQQPPSRNQQRNNTPKKVSTKTLKKLKKINKKQTLKQIHLD